MNGSDTRAAAPATTPIELSILIVSFNTRALTLACLDSIMADRPAVPFEVIVVDNASSDGSAEAIAAHPLGVRLIASAANLGFARANNVAAKRAHGRLVLLLNPDTEVRDCALDRLLDFAARRPAARIWGGRTLFADGRLNPSSCWARMTPWNLGCRALGLTGLFPRTNLFNGEAYGGWNRDGERAVDIVSGCFLLIAKADWDALGGFDPAFFMYGEEADLCLRARRELGARPAVTSTATIVHHGGASERTRTGKMVKLLAAKTTLVRRHWHPLLAPLGVALIAAWPRSRRLALSVAARLTGSDTHRAAAATWGEIAAQTSQWSAGYAAPAETAP